MAFYTIRPKSGTKTQWSTANPVLREREIGFEYPDGGLGTGEIKMKMGDGVTAWNDLEYAIMPLYIRDGQGNAVYDLPMTPQPNLLINADFKNGIINQRGKKEYSSSSIYSWIYSVDRWRVKNGSVSVGTNKVTIEANEENDCTFQQMLEKSNKGIAVIKCGAITGNAYFDSEKEIQLETDSIVTKIIDTDVDNIAIFLEANASVEIEYIKLEKGSIYTGMPQWDKTTELLKCMRYFQFIDINETIWSTQYNNQFERNIIFTLPMIKKPSITTDITDNYNVTDVSVVAKDNTRCSLRYTLDNSIGAGHRIGLRINADAETY